MSKSSVVSLVPWDITVRNAELREQPKKMLERPDADELIRSLSELEAYYTVKSLGVHEALPFLAVLEPNQIQALFDLDVWHSDSLNVDDLLVWLEAFREIGPERAQIALRTLDSELLALLLRRRLLIAIKSEEEDLPDWCQNPPEAIEPLIQTPDGRFIIAARAVDEMAELETGEDAENIDEESRKTILQLVELMYHEDTFDWAAGMLASAHGDLSSDLEETALRFRNARLEDLGFPPLSRAHEIYSPLKPESVLKGEPAPAAPTDLRLPAIHARSFSEGLLSEVLRQVESPERVRAIASELVPLANAALVADHIEPQDLEKLREGLVRVRGFLEIGIAHQTSPDTRIEEAKERLLSHPLQTLFRLGYSVTLGLRTRALELKKSGAYRAGSDDFGLLDDVDRAVLLALTESRRPRYPMALEGGPLPAFRPIHSIEDVERLTEALDDLNVLAKLSIALSFAEKRAAFDRSVDPPVPERSAQILLLTLAANIFLESAAEIRPLGKNELRLLAKRVENGEFPEKTVDAAVKRIASMAKVEAEGPLSRRLFAGLKELAEELAPLAKSEEIDPRFVGLVLRKLS